MIKSLFNENEAYVADAIELSDRVTAFVLNIQEEFAARGFSRRDIEYVIIQSVSVQSSESILRAQFDKRRKLNEILKVGHDQK